MPFATELIDRPGSSLSVAITGHRSIAAEPIVSKAVGAVITEILRELEKGSNLCTAGRSTSRRPRLKVISMLAEGADLLGMQAGLDCGAELIGVLPFAVQSYREILAGGPSRVLFDSVLDKLSSIVVLAGVPGDDASYEQANSAILDRCDVVIAVWDGDPARGPGGTGDVVRDALERGLPVILISPQAEPTPKLLGVAGETRFCAGSLDFLFDGARRQLQRLQQVCARADRGKRR